MTFAYPWAFALLIVAIGAHLRRRHRSGLTVASVDQWQFIPPGRSRFLWLIGGLDFLAIAFLIAAMARPQAGSSESVEEAEGIAIELLVDVSSSMDRTVDLPDRSSKTRMEIAKELLERFILGDGENLSGRPNDLIGLISFARYADTRSPLTFGHQALAQIVRNLEIQDRPNEDGTAYGDALTLACARLEKLDDLKSLNPNQKLADIESRIVVLLTDGENNSGSHLPSEAAGLAKSWGCRVYAISLGDSDIDMGGAVTIDEPEYSDAERTLQRISDETGGLFRRATGYESLRSIYEEIDALERTRIETRTYTVVSEWFWAPLALSLSLLALRLVLSSTWLRVVT